MTWLTLLPPLLAIAIAMWKKSVVPALLAAVFSAELLLRDFNPLLGFLGSVERLVAVFGSADNTRILLFSLLIGALLNLVRVSGGVRAFVDALLRRGVADSPRRAGLLTSGLGVLIFIESNLSLLASGIFAQKLFDRFAMSRARLAFLIDATCAPVSSLILINAWGAFILGLLEGQGLDNPLRIMLYSIPLNFYSLLALALAFYTAWSGRVHFALARHETASGAGAGGSPAPEEPTGRMRHFLAPLACLVLGTLGFMLYTGNGSLIEGSGTRSVLYATVLAVAAAALLLRLDGMFRHQTILEHAFKGMAELLPLVSVVLLALALGAAMQELGTGDFLAGAISGTLPDWSVPAVIFICAAGVSFTTGTSWGTFGLLVPVAIPIAQATGLSPSLLLAAVMGGGIFGDHSSPISDSTLLASLASGCDHFEHVRTQLPYALLAGGLSVVLYILFSL